MKLTLVTLQSVVVVVNTHTKLTKFRDNLLKFTPYAIIDYDAM